MLANRMLHIRERFNDSFLRGSLYLSASSLTRSGFGFIFWMVAARLYLQEDVGVATALISLLAIVVSVTRMGLDQSLTRYVLANDVSRLIVTCVAVTTLAAAIVGVFVALLIEHLVPDMMVVRQNFLIFMLFVVSSSVLSTLTVTFVAIRRAEIVVLQSLLGGSRILFLFPLVAMGAMGVFWSEALASIVMLLFSIFVLWMMKVRFMGIDLRFLKTSVRYSAGNYVGGLLLLLPTQLMPLMVLSLLGASNAAIFYICMMMFNLVLIVPNSAGQSLFVEGSHGEDLRKTVKKSLMLSGAFIAVCVIGIFAFGDSLLRLIGTEYAQGGVQLLTVLALAAFPVAGFTSYLSVLKVRNRIRDLVFISAFTIVCVLVSSYLFLQSYGLTGVGYSWLLSYTLSCFIAIIMNRRSIPPILHSHD